jgi:N-acetylmuramate 1-kinase
MAVSFSARSFAPTIATTHEARMQPQERLPRNFLSVSSSPRDEGGFRDSRLLQLRCWIEELLGTSEFRLEPASADASFRRYFRVTLGDRSWIAMDAPPEKEDMDPYVRVAAMLAAVGVNAPRIMERSVEHGFLLNSDLGSRTYLMELDSGADPAPLYADAMDALVRIQSRGEAHARRLPSYDDALLRREMGLFPEWYCRRHVGLDLTAADSAALAQAFEALTVQALRQPRVFVHRDYHSRNLMVGDGERYGANPGILDFQDAVYGPVTYDLVSLLRDCYIAWPRQRVHEWVAEFRRNAQASGVAAGASESEFLRWFDWMGVQRHLKAIGIFARLWHRDGKAGYLKDIPRTLNYLREVCGEYRELSSLRAFIDERVAPTVATAGAS